MRGMGEDLMRGTAGNGLIRVMLSSPVLARELLVTYRALLPVLAFHFASCIALKLTFQSYKPDPGRLTTLTQYHQAGICLFYVLLLQLTHCK